MLPRKRFVFNPRIECNMQSTILQIADHQEYYNGKRHIKVKLCADGAKYSRGCNFCLFSFSILRDGVVNLSSSSKLCYIYIFYSPYSKQAYNTVMPLYYVYMHFGTTKN